MCCYSSIKSSLCSLSMNTNILTASCSVQLSCWCLSEEIHSRIKEMSVFFLSLLCLLKLSYLCDPYHMLEALLARYILTESSYKIRKH